MTCQTCGAPFVSCGAERTTLVGYDSPAGHDHDDNCVKRTYLCENGHETVVSKRRRCPACDWIGQAECGCHQGPKVDEWPEVQKQP